jgi:hypothetical protein
MESKIAAFYNADKINVSNLSHIILGNGATSSMAKDLPTVPPRNRETLRIRNAAICYGYHIRSIYLFT